MGQSDAVQQGVTRLDAAADSISKSLDEFLEDIQSIATLREQVRTLTSKCDRLTQELESERSRAQRLEAANDEVSDRLETLTGTLKTIAPARGSAGLEF
jgi:chromosome segregation ATPase